MQICFITGPEGSGTTALLRALSNHPQVVQGDVVRYGHPRFRARAAEQFVSLQAMSAVRPSVLSIADPEVVCRLAEERSVRIGAAQPDQRALVFKYSTPARRPKRWPVFLPLFALPGFRVIVIRRRHIDSIYSAYRRFYRGGSDERGRGRASLGLIAAARDHVLALRHIGRQMDRSPRDRCLEVTYEDLVRQPHVSLGEVCAFAHLEYRPADELLPGSGFTNENGKWWIALRHTLSGGVVPGSQHSSSRR